MSTEEITLEQLSTNDTLVSLWIAVHGNVYDLTTFVNDHPGGVDVLVASAGTDGTEAFDYAGHSKDNTKELQQFVVGKLKGPQSSSSSTSSPPALSTVTKRMVKSTTSSLNLIKILQLVAFLGFLVVVYTQYGQQMTSTREVKADAGVEGRVDSTPAYSFWTGTALACSLGLLGANWVWASFRATLEYEHKYPATIPRRKGRNN